jgi:hypothetical protein
MEFNAPLDAIYGTEEPMPIELAIEDMLTTEPFCILRCAAQARTICKTPTVLTA